MILNSLVVGNKADIYSIYHFMTNLQKRCIKTVFIVFATQSAFKNDKGWHGFDILTCDTYMNKYNKCYITCRNFTKLSN